MASTTVAPQTRAERLKRNKRAARARAYNNHRTPRDSKLQHQQQEAAIDLYSPPVDQVARRELDQALRQEEEVVLGAFPLENHQKQAGAKHSEDPVSNYRYTQEAKNAVTATRDTEGPVITPPPPPPPPPAYRYTWDEDPISNMEEMKIMRQLTQGTTALSSAAKPQAPGSPASRLSKRSLGSSLRSNRSTRTLEEVVSLTILQTAAEGADSAHFLVQEQDRGAPFDEPPASTPDILADLLSLSVDGEPDEHPGSRPLSPAEKPSSPAPAEDMYSLYSMPVEDPDGWLPTEGEAVGPSTDSAVGPSTDSAVGPSTDSEEAEDKERATMRKTALMDDVSDMSSGIFRGQSLFNSEPREDPELIEEEGSADSDDDLRDSAYSHSSDGSRSLELAYSSSARDDDSTDDERVSLSERARNAMPVMYQQEDSSPSTGSRKSIDEEPYIEPAISDVFDGIDENAESLSDTSDSSDDEIQSAADRSGAFPSMLPTMQEAPGMESSEADTEEEEDDEWAFEDQLRVGEEAEKKEDLETSEPLTEEEEDWDLEDQLRVTDEVEKNDSLESSEDPWDLEDQLRVIDEAENNNNNLESSDSDTEDPWDLEDQLRVTEEAEKKGRPFKSTFERKDDDYDDWTAFEDSPFADATTELSKHIVEDKDDGDDGSHGAPTKGTDVSSRTDGSGETAPLPSSEDLFPDSPTSIADFSGARLTQPEVKSIGMEEWDSNNMAEI